MLTSDLLRTTSAHVTQSKEPTVEDWGGEMHADFLLDEETPIKLFSKTWIASGYGYLQIW